MASLRIHGDSSWIARRDEHADQPEHERAAVAEHERQEPTERGAHPD